MQYINYDLFCVSINNEINVFTHLFWSIIFVLDDNSVVENFTLLEERGRFKFSLNQHALLVGWLVGCLVFF